MGGQAKFKDREKSDFDKYGYKLRNSSFAARFTPSLRTRMTKEEKTDNARLRQIRELCAQIVSQRQLNDILDQIDDPDERRGIFEIYLPYLPFDAIYPD